MSALEAQILFARAVVLLLLYGFLTVIGWLAWTELKRQRPSRAAGETPVARLVVIHGAESGWPAGTSFPLDHVTVVGRDLDTGVVLADPTLSGRHATVMRDPDGWWVEDLASTNGTYVNGDATEPGSPVPVRSGDEIWFGAVRARLVIPVE